MEKFLKFDLRRRKKSANRKQHKVIISHEKVPVAKMAVIVMDIWNYHWCKTCAAHVEAMIPRINRALDVAHSIGIPIIHSPTDVVSNYRDYPQRRAMLALPYHPMPSRAGFTIPDPAESGGKNAYELGECMCGADMCLLNNGQSAMHVDVKIREDDYICGTVQELYNLCAERGITHLLYVGFATNVCVLDKPEGMIPMTDLGFTCIICRDQTEAFGRYDPESRITADDITANMVIHIETYIGPSIDLGAVFKKAGLWCSDWVVDGVMITPWGKKTRPCMFQEAQKVMLTIPRLKQVEIRYTLDNSEPTKASLLYAEPLMITETTNITAAAFQDGKMVSLPSKAFFVRRPALPPMPDVHLSRLIPLLATAAKGFKVVTDKSTLNTVFEIHDRKYQKGIGTLAPSEVVYQLDPAYDRFVALAGVDSVLMCFRSPKYHHAGLGEELALFPNVTFQIFIDDTLVEASPLMRIQERPWPFNIKIPTGSKIIRLVVTAGSDGHCLDHADWVNAGFIVKKTHKPAGRSLWVA